MTTETRTHDIETDGLCLRLIIEEDFRPDLGYPDDRMASKGRVIAAEVLEVVDEEKAYRNLAELKGA